jgi:hypothetical protein
MGTPPGASRPPHPSPRTGRRKRVTLNAGAASRPQQTVYGAKLQCLCLLMNEVIDVWVLIFERLMMGWTQPCN